MSNFGDMGSSPASLSPGPYDFFLVTFQSEGFFLAGDDEFWDFPVDLNTPFFVKIFHNPGWNEVFKKLFFALWKIILWRPTKIDLFWPGTVFSKNSWTMFSLGPKLKRIQFLFRNFGQFKKGFEENSTPFWGHYNSTKINLIIIKRRLNFFHKKWKFQIL